MEAIASLTDAASSGPGWVPLNSAASGAAFAGVLAALVVTISIQISTRADRLPGEALSLKATMPTLVTLLVASYLYIVLDGIPNTADEIKDFLAADLLAGRPADPTKALDDYTQLAARGFAIGGTVLALGTFMAIFIVAASIFDNTEPSERAGDDVAPGVRATRVLEARDWALGVLRVAGAVIAIILLFGYAIGARSLSASGVGPCWWVGHGILLAGPMLAVWAASLDADAHAVVGRVIGAVWTRLGTTLVVFVLAGVPTVAFVVVISLRLSGGAPLTVYSLASALYFGVGAAVLLHLLEGQDPSRTSRSTTAT